jgi:glycosyltransferase involved in cell wall biosynthesis
MLDGVKVRYFSSSVLRRLYWAPTLARALRCDMPGADAVHLHSVFLWPTWAAAREAKRSGVPYVLSPRGMLVHKLIESRHRRLKTAWITLIERSNLEAASAVHVTSSNEAEALATFGFQLKGVATIPNGLDDVVESPSPDPPPDIKALSGGQPLVLFLGRLSWVKGLDRLLCAFARTTVGRLAIVGTDFDNLAAHLRELASELGIAQRFHLIPRTVLGPDKEAVFAAASAFILPSLSESFGNAALEAMQRGLPAIVTRGVGVSDIIEGAGNGIVVEDTVDALALAMQRLLADPDGCRSMGASGRQHVAERYGWAAVAPRMEALYQSLQH